MKSEYDFKNARKNPYTEKLQKQITIDIDNEVIEFFETQSNNTGIPFQKLINLYLADCVFNNTTIPTTNTNTN